MTEKRGRGRLAGFTMGNHHRDKIAKSNIVRRFIDAAEGKLTVSSVEAQLLIAGVKKIVPDLAAVEHSGDVQTSYVVRMPSAVADLDEWRKQQEDQTVSKPSDLTTH